MRAVSFGVDPRRYDALRPAYPPAVVEVVLPAEGVRVLDVGCGTGIATRLFAERGCEVLGVEPDSRMAAVARSTGVPVEVTTFEAWDPRGRVFDAVVCAQAWWWLDRPVAIPKLAAVLRPGGRVAVMWNGGRAADALTLALSDVYERVAPAAREPMLPGDGPDVIPELDESGLFGPAQATRCEWVRRYSSSEWAGAAATFGDVIGLPDVERDALLAEVEATIDAHGGVRDVHVVTHLVTATRLA